MNKVLRAFLSPKLTHGAGSFMGRAEARRKLSLPHKKKRINRLALGTTSLGVMKVDERSPRAGARSRLSSFSPIPYAPAAGSHRPRMAGGRGDRLHPA
jgi:hypothetical protein